MWWLDPGKEVLNVLFNRILAPYVQNLDLNQVNYGIAQGQLTLRNLKLKKGALDKFQLPVDVLAGHLGKFTLSLHWMNLGNQPVEILIEDVYLLVVPSPQTSTNPEEDEARAQAAKAERLENAELLHVRGQAEASADESTQSQGLLQSLIAKVINNVQVTVKNIHVRYEDNMSVPGHPFAAGVTLAGFTAVSVDGNWRPAFIESTAGAIHKLAKLQSLSVYFDTDAPSMSSLPVADSVKKFSEMISHGDNDGQHQYILKPVSGEGKVIVNHRINRQTPRFDIELGFEEIGVVLDDNQYRDAISLVDMYHVYLRKRQYGKYRPSEEEFDSNPAKARLKYAMNAIVGGIHERNRRWTWAYFAERRDDRNEYVGLFQKKLLSPSLLGTDLQRLEALEKKMTYEDIRFYRSIARSKVKKDVALRKKLEAERKQQAQRKSWSSWLWGTSPADSAQDETGFGGPMTEEQRKQLYDVLDFDEKEALAEALQAPQDSLKMRIIAKLRKGSFALRTDPHNTSQEVMSVVFDVFRADFIQRPDNFETSISLNGLKVFDGTTAETLYPQIVHVKGDMEVTTTAAPTPGGTDESEPFFFVKFEKNPLDERADSALTVRMRHMEIIYHRGYVEAVYKFFKPPASQLESVEALLNVASQTLEGLRRETRAGLEYALQTHKTVDIQMDLNAPIIIIPESVKSNDCKHLIIDAGHIAIESDLVAKEAIRTIQLKKNEKYNDEDYQNLESLMYDKLSLRLAHAQFIVGDNLQSCREALASHVKDSLHILERVSFDLRIEKSIVPTAVNLAQFKVSGTLPSLQINLSDTKYKSLMRLIDVCIPHFGEDQAVSKLPETTGTTSNSFSLPTNLFGPTEQEYNVDDDDQDEEADSQSAQQDEFYEAEQGTVDRPGLRQHTLELEFKVENLRAMVTKSSPDGVDKPLGELYLEGFALSFALAKYDMKVDINLSSVMMNVVQPIGKDIQFISTPAAGPSTERHLLQISYCRVEKESPDFLTIAEGIDQNVDIKISTLIFRVAPEPILALYDFVMATFVSNADRSNEPGAAPTSTPAEGDIPTRSPANQEEGKIRVLVKFEGVQMTLINEMLDLATLSLSTADVTVFLRAKTLRVSGRLGNMTLANNHESHKFLDEFNQLVSIDGENFVDFRYQTYDPDEEHYTGVKSSVHFNAASVKLNFVEEPLHALYLFFTKLARLKGLYDAATQVAVQRASEIDRMQFEVSVKSPIAIFPSNSSSSSDALVLRLGEIDARNISEPTTNRIIASLRGIHLVSYIHRGSEISKLKIIDDINISANAVQSTKTYNEEPVFQPGTQMEIQVSDVKLSLTQSQYCILMQLANEIPRVFSGNAASEITTGNESTSSEEIQSASQRARTPVDLEPELHASQRNWTTLDLVLTINVVKLHLYDAFVFSEADLRDHGIARFALNDNSLRFKLLSDGSGEAQIVLRSFTISNTRPGNNKFREIIPAAQHNRNQFMLLYSMSGGGGGPSLAVLTVDSPQVIFAIDPVISLFEFFNSAFGNQDLVSPSVEPNKVSGDMPLEKSQGDMHFRLDLHDVSISILENDSDAESRAIRLYVDQVLLAQQGILALTVNRLGMSLIRMGRVAESVRFLDEVDLTFSLDSRSSSAHQMTSMEIASKPIVFRASYRDINLISSIINKAIERYGYSQQSLMDQKQQDSKTITQRISGTHAASQAKSLSLAQMRTDGQSIGRARVLMSKEMLKLSCDGFRLVLIGDLHEQPMLHLKIKPFAVDAQDWSGQLHATTTMTTSITYWNLTNSHWEPLIDPWTFTLGIAKENPTAGLDLNLLARERLDLNISTTFTELALTTLNTWRQEGESVLQKARGTYAPYRIRNQSGTPIFVWSDVDGFSNVKDAEATKILHDQTVDWRFDDWKAMREHVSSGQHNIGIQFAEKPWEQLRGIPVDREGEFVYSLRPRTEKYPSRLLCEVKVVDNTKIVTIRSTYKVENSTLYPIELMLVDESGRPVYSLEKIPPGKDFSLPIDAVTRCGVRIQPDQGFGYKWSAPIRWEDLIARKSFTLKCPHGDPKEATFRIQAWAQVDTSQGSSKYPKINLKLRAPLELENLLPYNLEYRIYDKNTNQNWRSYLRKGGVMPVHSVELGHFILLNINVQDTVYKPSEFTIINTDGHSDFDIEYSLTLRDHRDRKLDLRLNYVRYPDSGGAFKVQIYSPFIVVNKTGLPFSIRSGRSTRAGSQDVAGETRSDILSQTTPFLLSHLHKQGHEFIFKIGDSGWSKLVSFEAPAAETELIVPLHNQKSDEYHIGLSWSEGLGKYKLTKVIYLTPRFLIKNQLPTAITFRELGVAPREPFLIEPGQRHPFQVLRSSSDKLLTIAYPGLNARWSPPINIEDIGSVHFRLPRSREPGQQDLVRADIRIDGPSIFIFFNTAADWPFMIENSSDYTVYFSQQDVERDPQSRETLKYHLEPRTSMPYAWDFPAARDKKILLSIGSARRVVDIMEIGDLIPFRFSDQQRIRAVSLDVRADGSQQILRITNYNPDQSLYKPRQRSSSVTVARQDTISSTAEAFEAITEEVTSNFSITLNLAGVGVSLINKKLVEVIYLVVDGIKFEYVDSAVAQSVNISCGTLQIDNQLHEALFPVILQPTPITKNSEGVGALPTVQASVIWLKDQEHGVLFIKYCSVLLQALTIEADEDLLFAVYDLTQIRGASWEEGVSDVLIQHPNEIPEPTGDAVGQVLYFEVLELQPIKLSLSFMRTERINSEEKLSIKNPLAVVVNALTMTVGNINDAPLEMNALAIKDMRLTMPELLSRIAYHYRQDILRQLYRILGSADFIGNPVGLFTNVSSGVADIFYEPFQGVIVHGNKELGVGIAKGAASFVKKTVFGLSDSVTKFTSSLGKGLSAATFDSEYQARRRMNQRRNKPRHAIYGVTAGGEAFASSVTSAMEGVFMKPIEGAEAEGALGFFKGVGKGLVGAVTKPVVGVFDLASNVSEGIRNTTTVFDKPDRDRIRLPRVVPADGVLRPYNSREALGQSWMKDLNNGAYRREFYVAHINSPGGDNVILLTATRILSFWSKRLRLEWELPLTQIQGVTVEDTGIRFAHKAGKEHDRFAFIPDKASQSWFFSQVASVVKAFNARRRMDT